jgi:hypothetical protein
VFERLSSAAMEMLRFIESGAENGRYENELLDKYGSDDGNYRLKILLDADYVFRATYHPNSYRLAPRGTDLLVWERKRIDNKRQGAEKRDHERKYANRKGNVAITISVAALLVSLLANLDKIVASVQMIACWVQSVFH